MLRTIVCLSCLGLGAGLDYSMTAKTHSADYSFVAHIRARADSVQASFAEMKSYLTPPPVVMPVEPAPIAVAYVIKPRVVPAVPVAAPVRDVTLASAAPVTTPVWQPAVSAVVAIQPDAEIAAAQPEAAVQPEVLVIASADTSDDMGLEGLTDEPSEGLADDEATIAEMGVAKEVSALQRKASARLQASADQSGENAVLASNEGTVATRFADRACVMRAGVRTCGTN